MRDEAWLPRGVSPSRREPIGRVIAVVIVAIVLAGGVGAAAFHLARRPPNRAVVASTTVAEQTGVPTMPIPSSVPSTTTDRRTIDAAGPNTIPANLTLPHENDPKWLGANLRLDACPHATPESGGFADATDVRTIAATNDDDVTRSETLAIGADEGAASQIYDEFVTAMQQCDKFATDTSSEAPSVQSPSPSSTSATVKPLKDNGKHLQTDWTRSTIMVLKFPGLDEETQDTASYLLVAQAGRAIVLGAVVGADAPSKGVAEPAVVRSLQAFADAMAPKVCIFKSSGCAAPTIGGPGGVQFPPGSVILPDGNVMLPNGVIVDPAGRPVPSQAPGVTTSAPPAKRGGASTTPSATSSVSGGLGQP